MMNRGKRIGMGLGVVVSVLAACGGPIHDSSQFHTHDCPVTYNGPWMEQNLLLDHADSRTCPIEFASFDSVSTSGTVTDLNATYPDEGDPIQLTLRVCDVYHYPSWDCTGVELGGPQSEFFNWEPHGPSYEWRAYQSVDYLAGSTPDRAEFRLWLFSTSSDAIAVVDIEFCGETCDEEGGG